MISLIKKVTIILSFLTSQLVWSQSIQDELSDLNVSDQGLLKEADFSDSLLDFAKGNDRPLNLTSKDKETLKLLGYSDQEINDLSIGTFVAKEGREKLTSRLSAYGNKKSGEIDEGVRTTLVPGLASSVIGLSLASLLGITVGVKCSSQPSALAFAGASAAWVGLEMMIWKGYQIRMKDIETLSQITKIPKMISEKSQRAKKLIKGIEEDFKVSDTADINLFLDSKKAEIDELKQIADELYTFLKKAKDKQFGALRSIQESIALAAETSKKKARNAKVAAIGFTAAAGVAAMEAMNFFTAGGNCFSKASIDRPKNGPQKLMALLASVLVRDAHAGFASVGDLDKIGIPIGAGLAAAYIGFEKKFADKIYNSATTRSVVFIAMAGMAYFASKKLADAAKFLDTQAKEMKLFVDTMDNLVEGRMVTFPSGEELIRSLKEDLLPSLEDVIKESVDVDKIKGDLADLGTELGVSSEEELKELASEELEKLNEQELIKELGEFGKSSEDLKNLNGDDFIGRVTYEKSLIESLLDSLTSEAYAVKPMSSSATRPSCFYRTKRFLRMNESCSCLKSGNCSRTLFPTQPKIKASAKPLMAIYQFAARADQANNMIMRGKPNQGIQIYKGLYTKVAKVDAMTRSVISRKISKPLSLTATGKMSVAMIRSSKPSLVDYLKKRRVKRAPIAQVRRSPLLAKEVNKKERRHRKLRQKIQKNIMMAKALGNPNLKRFEVATVGGGSLDENVEYAYDKESIVRDKSKNIFNIIKKRYLIIMKDGRL